MDKSVWANYPAAVIVAALALVVMGLTWWVVRIVYCQLDIGN
jgi:hypothetical protein